MRRGRGRGSGPGPRHGSHLRPRRQRPGGSSSGTRPRGTSGRPSAGCRAGVASARPRRWRQRPSGTGRGRGRRSARPRWAAGPLAGRRSTGTPRSRPGRRAAGRRPRARGRRAGHRCDRRARAGRRGARRPPSAAARATRPWLGRAGRYGHAARANRGRHISGTGDRSGPRRWRRSTSSRGPSPAGRRSCRRAGRPRRRRRWRSGRRGRRIPSEGRGAGGRARAPPPVVIHGFIDPCITVGGSDRPALALPCHPAARPRAQGCGARAFVSGHPGCHGRAAA